MLHSFQDCRLLRTTTSRTWDLKTRVWHICIIAAWNITPPCPCSSSAASVWIVRCSPEYRWQHHSPNSWNESTVVGYQPFRLFHISILGFFCDATSSQCLPGHCKQDGQDGNFSKER